MSRLVLAACLAASLLAPGSPAVAAEPAAPVIISPVADDDFISEETELRATAETPYVLFRLSHGSAGPFIQDDPVAVVDGEATDMLPAYGLPTFGIVYVTALACTGATVDTCSSSSQVRASRGGTATTGLAMQPTDFVDPTIEDLSAEVAGNPGGTLELRAFTNTDEPAIATYPVQFGANQVDVSGLADASYTWRVFRCSVLNPVVCASYTSARSLPVRRAINLDAWIWNEGTLSGYERYSPNGDGFQDKPTIKVYLGGVANGTLTWSLHNEDGAKVNPGATFDVVHNQEFVIDPKTGGGATLPDGDYELRLKVTYQHSGHEYVDTDQVTFGVWNTRSLNAARAQYPTFYPVYDEYRDTNPVNVIANGDMFTTTFEVLNANKKVVYVAKHEAPGKHQLSWDGRRVKDANKLFPEGRYRYRLTVERNGETKTVTTPYFRLSHEKLVTRTWRKTVSAQASLIDNRSGRCSSLAVPSAGRPGSVAYLSSSRCAGGSGPAGTALGIHAIKLPRAAVYRHISLYYGGGSRDVHYGAGATIGPVRSNGELMNGNVAGAAYDSHYYAFDRPARTMVRPNRTVRWYARTRGGMRYVVDDYTIVVTLEVLR